MEQERFALDWQLETTQKWIVDRITAQGGGTGTGTGSGKDVVTGNVVEFDSGVVIVNSKPWAFATHKASKDILEGYIAPATSVRPTVRIELVRATCLICEEGPLTTQPTIFWIATQQGGFDSYDRDWKLGRGWTVRAADTLNFVKKGNEVAFISAGTSIDVKVNTTVWGKIATYDEKLDKATGTRTTGGAVLTIRRRTAVICTFPESGGNSWIAVEGGRP
jgi:hypothetical protein